MQDRFIYTFEKNIDEPFIKFLETFGKVTVFRNFPKPLIKMDITDRFRLSAIMSANSIDIFFKEKKPNNYIEKFEKKLNKFLEI